MSAATAQEVVPAPVRLVFVVGASRSGTTMVNRLLGRSSSALAMNELHFFGPLWDPRQRAVRWERTRAIEVAALLHARLRAGVWVAGPDADDRLRAQPLVEAIRDRNGMIEPAKLYRAVVDHAARSAGCKVVVEQTPGNVFFMAELAELYPDARFVQLVRDPRAVQFSQRQRWRKRWRDAPNMPWREVLRNFVNYHPVTMTQLWRRAWRCATAMRDSARHRRQSYEELVRYPEREIEALCRFLGVDFDPAMLRIPRKGSSHVLSTREQGFDPKLATAWQGRLGRGAIWLSERFAGDCLKQAGYKPLARSYWAIFAVWPVLLYPLHVAGVVLVDPGGALQKFRAVFRRRSKT